MKVSFENRLTNYNNIYFKRNIKPLPQINYSQKEVIGDIYGSYYPIFSQLKEQEYCQNFLNKEGKVTIEEAREIIAKHPMTLAKSYRLIAEKKDSMKSKKLLQTPKCTAKAAYNLKKYFSKNYKNYRIISIGTSPASITEAMEHLGAEVIYVPASSLGKLKADTYLTFSDKKKPEELRNVRLITKYIKSKLMGKENDKYNIVLDYTCTGNSLKMFCELLKNKVGIDKDKLISASLYEIMDIIRELESEKVDLRLSNSNIEDIVHDCIMQTSEKLCNVPHFDIDDNINYFKNKENDRTYICSRRKTFPTVFKEFENYSTPLARAYSLCTFNELRKMNLV